MGTRHGEHAVQTGATEDSRKAYFTGMRWLGGLMHLEALVGDLHDWERVWDAASDECMETQASQPQPTSRNPKTLTTNLAVKKRKLQHTTKLGYELWLCDHHEANVDYGANQSGCKRSSV